MFFLHRLARVAQQGIDPFGVLAHAGISFGGQLIHRLSGNRGDHGRARVARAVHIQRVVKGLNLQRNARLCQAAGGPCQQEQDHHQPFRHECHEIAPPFLCKTEQDGLSCPVLVLRIPGAPHRGGSNEVIWILPRERFNKKDSARLVVNPYLTRLLVRLPFERDLPVRILCLRGAGRFALRVHILCHERKGNLLRSLLADGRADGRLGGLAQVLHVPDGSIVGQVSMTPGVRCSSPGSGRP